MDGTFVIEQFGYEFKVGHILQVPALFHLLCKEAYGTGYQSDYSGGESDLHIVSHGSTINGEVLYEVDLINMVEIVDGVDLMEAHRNALGL